NSQKWSQYCTTSHDTVQRVTILYNGSQYCTTEVTILYNGSQYCTTKSRYCTTSHDTVQRSHNTVQRILLSFRKIQSKFYHMNGFDIGQFFYSSFVKTSLQMIHLRFHSLIGIGQPFLKSFCILI